MSYGWRLGSLLFVATGAAAVRIIWLAYGRYAGHAVGRHHLESAWLLFAALAIVVAASRSIGRPTAEAAPASAPDSTTLSVVLVVLLQSVGLLVYWPAFGVGLLSDDYVLLAGQADRWEFFRPLPLLVWRGVYPIAGQVGLHVVNVTLHGLNAWLVYCVVRRIPGAERVVAMFAALLFLTFPAAVEPVAWMSGLFDVLLATLALGYVLALARTTIGGTITAVACAVGALLTKETAVALPALGLLVAAYRPVNRLALGLSGVVALGYAGVRLVRSADAPIPETVGPYFIKEMIVRPFASLAAPWTAEEISRHPWFLGFLPHLLFAGIVIVWLTGRRVSLRPLAALLWVLLSVAPLLSLLFIGPFLEGSRYLYLALGGWCLFLAMLAADEARRVVRFALASIAVAMVAVGAVGVRHHLRAWSDAAALRDRVLASAVESVQQAACSHAQFTEAPDSIRGAYLFRNGLDEALRARGVTVSPAAPARCRFAWNGSAFLAK